VHAATTATLNLTNVNKSTAAAHLAELAAEATGAFRADLSAQAQAAFGQVISGSKVSSVGTVNSSAISSISSSQAVVLVAVTSTVRNSQAPAGQSRAYRLRVSLQRSSGHWLVSNLEFVA
jgi:Mce-associated membrane protein